MADADTALIQKRKMAYSYVMDLFKKVSWNNKDFKKDANVADVLKIDVTELISLKNGEINPGEDLVQNMHEFFCGNEKLAEEIDSFLVEPFSRGKD